MAESILDNGLRINSMELDSILGLTEKAMREHINIIASMAMELCVGQTGGNMRAHGQKENRTEKEFSLILKD